MTETCLDVRVRLLGEMALQNGVDRLVISDSLTVSWLLGIRSNVRLGADQPCFSVELDWRSGDCVVNYVIPRHEADRVRASLRTDVKYSGCSRYSVYEWSGSAWDDLDSSGSVGTDVRRDGLRFLGPQIEDVRRVLQPEHRRDLRALTAEVTNLVETIALRVTPSFTELEIAAQVASEALLVDGEPLVVLVGSGRDQFRFKHPVPRAVPVCGRVVISVGVRRHGVVTSVTRYLTFDPLAPHEHQLYRGLLEVEAAMLNASVPGARLSDGLEAGKAAYRQQGFPDGTWREHHQGGLAGFAPREILAGRDQDPILLDGAVVAWNPSAAGFKVEEVALVRDGGAQAIGAPGPNWPSVAVAGRQRPAVLQA
ncbi:M24 family metallopeptidase [Demequina aurantiaca]|uniref:M24 family metallopeptidase n=1 Tax=Demequina aurantiaca TaxID=676200 RepID=UPI003D34EE0B